MCEGTILLRLYIVVVCKYIACRDEIFVIEVQQLVNKIHALRRRRYDYTRIYVHFTHFCLDANTIALLLRIDCRTDGRTGRRNFFDFFDDVIIPTMVGVLI